MYQLIVPISFVGIVFYLNHKCEEYAFDKNCLHNGTFDDFYVVDVKKDL